MERENFPQYYTILFNGIADALKALDQQETSRAWDILVRIQQEAEDAKTSADIKDDEAVPGKTETDSAEEGTYGETQPVS